MLEERNNVSELSPYGALFRNAVEAAHSVGASDIHIEPGEKGVTIRFRVFGEMQTPWKILSSEHKHSFITTAKKETRLAIGVSGRAQDSRCNVEGVPVDLRVNLIPTLFGEKIVLRLLDSGREFGIENLGIPDESLADLMAALNYRNGVVLMSGPTGSGKTTTLYSMLCAIDRMKKNIITLEDPVEYTIAGINQVPVSSNVTFASALRAILRQDPDVILVGEIRDEETAHLAFKAAATGHLVLSTLHANGAAEVVGRLLGLGIDKDTLRDNLRFSAAQRLVGKLCLGCSVPAPADVLKNVNSMYQGESTTNLESKFRVRNELGCSLCRNGVSGRVPVIEYMISKDVTQFLNDADRNLCLRRTLQQAAHELARMGLIDAREVINIG